MSKIKTRIQTPTDSYVRCYPKIVELANKQLEDQLWFSSEMKVELDKMQLKYELSPEQQHTVKFLLNLFVKYELEVGSMWAKIGKIFPRPEIKLAASVVEMVERAVHAEFYNQINIQLGLDTDEHYLQFMDDPILKERAEWLGKLISDKEDEELAVIIFGMTETALLFSPFSMLKSFQSNGNNKIPVVARGTNQSAIDEDLHGIIAAEIINTWYLEQGISLKEDKPRYKAIREAVHQVYEHEERIVDLAIIGESLNGATKQEYKEFVKHRLNIYLERLNLPHEFEVGECSIIDWFEKNTYSYKVIDFFSSGQGQEYELGWNKHGFGNAWRKKE